MKKLSNIKAVVMDLDGSVLENGRLPKKTAHFIEARLDLTWIVATGRSFKTFATCAVPPLLHPDSIHCLEGGGRVMGVTGDTIFETLFTIDELNDFFNQIEPDDVSFIYYAVSPEGGFLYTQSEDLLMEGLPSLKMTNKIEDFKRWTLENRPSKIALKLKKVKDFKNLNWTRNEKQVDITPEGVDKGYAVKKILDYLKIDPSEAVFICNDYNDLPVIEALPGLIPITVGGKLANIDTPYKSPTPNQVTEILERII